MLVIPTLEGAHGHDGPDRLTACTAPSEIDSDLAAALAAGFPNDLVGADADRIAAIDGQDLGDLGRFHRAIIHPVRAAPRPIRRSIRSLPRIVLPTSVPPGSPSPDPVPAAAWALSPGLAPASEPPMDRWPASESEAEMPDTAEASAMPAFWPAGPEP